MCKDVDIVTLAINNKMLSLRLERVPLFLNYPQVFVGLNNILKGWNQVRRNPDVSEFEGSVHIWAPHWWANEQWVPERIGACASPLKAWCVPLLCNQVLHVFCSEELVRWWGEGAMIKLKKSCILGRTRDSPAISARAAGWIMQEAGPPRVSSRIVFAEKLSAPF